MSDQPVQPETGIHPPHQPGEQGRGEQDQGQSIDPQRLLRIAGVTRELLDEARRIRGEPGAVAHIREAHSRISNELQEALPQELYGELRDLTPEIREGSLEELALAHAEILGWLEGLFQGTQLALQVQAAQAAAQATSRAFQERGRPPLPGPNPGPPPEPQRDVDDPRYL
jgi:proteasome activator-like protein